MKLTTLAALAALALTSTLMTATVQAQPSGCFAEGTQTLLGGKITADNPMCWDGKSININSGGAAPIKAAPPAVDPGEEEPPVVDPTDPTDPGEEEPVDPTDPGEEEPTEVPSTPINTDPDNGGPTPTEGTYVFEVPAIVNLDATAGVTQVAPGAYIVTSTVVDANASALLGIPAGTYSGTVFNGKATIRLDVIPL